MAHQYDRFVRHESMPALKFYIDRVLRLIPTLFIAIILVYIFGAINNYNDQISLIFNI